MATRSTWVGIDLGATNAKAAVVSDNGAIVSQAALPLDTSDAGLAPEPVVAKLLECCELALAEAGLGWGAVAGVGVGSPGALDVGAGLVKVGPSCSCCSCCS